MVGKDFRMVWSVDLSEMVLHFEILCEGERNRPDIIEVWKKENFALFQKSNTPLLLFSNNPKLSTNNKSGVSEY